MTNKTPEQMAEEYADESPWHLIRDSWTIARDAFLAGYKAAKEEEATKDQKIAELWTESIRRMLPSVHEITLFPSKPSNDEVVAKMDAAIEKAKGNSSNNSNGWIPVSERLPEFDEWVLIDGPEVCKRIAPPSSNWKEGYAWETNHASFYSPNDVTHWMPLPEAPKGEG